MTPKQREQVKQQQLERYYTEPLDYFKTLQQSQHQAVDYNPFEKEAKSQSVRKENNKLRNKEKLAGKRSFRNNIIE